MAKESQEFRAIIRRNELGELDCRTLAPKLHSAGGEAIE
jgi:hypothetical protein